MGRASFGGRDIASVSARRHLHDHDSGEGLIPVDDARDRILSRIEALSPVELPLREAHGCVLAEAAVATNDVPSFASSAMDGFALRASETTRATSDRPTAFAIVGEVAMGRPAEVAVPAGCAVRIPTGGMVPDEADCVVPVEHCVVDEDRVLVLGASEAGRYVRPAGEDARTGDVLVPAGRRLLAPDLGFLAAAGLGSLWVHPRPHVAIFSTGDELVEAGAPASAGQVPDANSVTLSGAIRETGAHPLPASIIPDDPDSLRDAVASVAGVADAVVASGGVSVGALDPVRRAFIGSGEVGFYGVAMQPGMPQAFGIVNEAPFFGLPGNPGSVFVSFEVFVRPALLKMMGRRSLFRTQLTVRLEADIAGPKGKAVFARVLVRTGTDGWVAATTGSGQSNLLGTASRANGLAIIPPGIERLHAGDRCTVMLFRDIED
jgi:molybdopterin molybdotransferase